MPDYVFSEAQKSFSVVITKGFSVLVLIFGEYLTPFLPGTEIIVLHRVMLSVLIRFFISTTIAVFLLLLYPHLYTVVGYYVERALRKRFTPKASARAVSIIAPNLVLLASLFLVGWVVLPSYAIMLALLVNGSWPFSVSRLLCLAVGVYSFAKIYFGVSPLLGHAGSSLASRLLPVSDTTCPACGASLPQNAQFCQACGAKV